MVSHMIYIHIYHLYTKVPISGENMHFKHWPIKSVINI